MRGRQIRLYIGEAGQTIDSLEARYFVIDSMDGPTPQGEFTITAQDIIKFASGDRVVAPRPSNGFLNADITNRKYYRDDNSAARRSRQRQYGATAIACIGGSEIVYLSTPISRR